MAKTQSAQPKVYQCLCCGKTYNDPFRNFPKSQYSRLWDYNNKYIPICQKCLAKLFRKLSVEYNSKKTALILCCYMLDIPFLNSVYESINEKNSNFSIGLYTKQLNGLQYKNKTFETTIITGELSKSEYMIQEEAESHWSKEDIQNKKDVIGIVGYDPFEGYREEDRKFSFNELIKYLRDEDTQDDTYKISQIIQIVNNNNQIRNYDSILAKMSNDPSMLSKGIDIKAIISNKTSLIDSNNKIAKENEISVKNRSNKDAGKSSLGGLMKKYQEMDIKEVNQNYYNQLKSEGMQWIVGQNLMALKSNSLFDENDTQEIIINQREKVIELQSQLNDLTEEKRLLLKKIDAMKLFIEENNLEFTQDGDFNEKTSD